MNSSLGRALAALRKARLSGNMSACFFLLAVLLVADGLQALMRGDFSRIDLPLGGQALMSGAMPLQAKTHTDIVADIEGLGGLTFTPLADFKGFWLGAHMWRATLDAHNATEAGRAVLTIVDLVPAKSTTSNATIMVQNPSQIFAITVWSSEEAMQAAHFSLSRRLTGLNAFLAAGLTLACGIAISLVNVLLFHTAQRALAREGIFTIYGIRKTDAGYQATFSQCDRGDLLTGRPMSLLTPQGAAQGKGVLGECAPNKCNALLPLDGVPPRYGWLLRYEADAGAALDPETDTPARST